MKKAHQHLNITEKEWLAMVADLKETLNMFHIPEKEQKELLAIVENTKRDVQISEWKWLIDGVKSPILHALSF